MSPNRLLVLMFVLMANMFALPVNNGSPTGNVTTEPSGVADDSDTGSMVSRKSKDMPYIAATELENCTLVPEDSSITFQIRDALKDGAKMIKFYLNIKNQERLFAYLGETNQYQPFVWVRAKDQRGTGILFLRPEYEVLSLATLGIGVETIFVNLTHEPRGCLNNLSFSDIELLIRKLVMNDFKDTRSSKHLALLDSTDSVCNLHIINSDGIANFKYFCCQRNTSSEPYSFMCGYIEAGTWLNMLLNLITVLKVLVVLFSPSLVPKMFYRLPIKSRYWYKIQHKNALKLKTLITKNPENYERAKNKIKLSTFRLMKKFKLVLKDMHKTLDTPKVLELNHVQLRVKHGCLLSATSAPVTLFKMIYQSIINCNIISQSSLSECSDTNILPCSKCECTWYIFLKRFFFAVYLIVLTSPWIVRCFFYFQYEHEEMLMRKYAASEKSLRMEFPGDVSRLLTPLHVLFIVVYALLILETCIFGLMVKKMKEQFKFVFAKTFHDMNETDFGGVASAAVKFLVYPCEQFGGLGLIIGFVMMILSLPFFILIFACYMIPTLNITLRLLSYFLQVFVSLLPGNLCEKVKCFAGMSQLLDKIEEDITMKDIEDADVIDASVMKSKWKMLQQFVVIVMCLVTLYSVIFLVMEFVSFFVEMLVYTMIGLILNAEVTLSYASLAVLLAVYAYECFHSVGKKYASFNKTMNEAIIELCREKIADNVCQTNIAFRVKSNEVKEHEIPVQFTSIDDNQPAWQFSRLLLFIGQNDLPTIPKTFFFKSCNMPFYTVPKGLLANYIQAVIDFAKIVLFLMFVFVVVLAFGDAYQISATNKMLAAIAGGLLPFMLKTFVFKAHAVDTVDKGNMHFQRCLQNLIKGYQETWPVYDIELGSIPSDVTVASQPENIVVTQPETSGSSQSDTTSVSMASVKDKTDTILKEIDPVLDDQRGQIIDTGEGEETNGAVNGADIDLLIYYSDEINANDFPDML